MGEINEADLPKINKIISTINFKALNTKIDFYKPYRKGSYIFVDVKDSSTFKEDFDNLLKNLDNLLVPHKHSGSTPHITLGYVPEDVSAEELKKIDTHLERINDVPSTVLGFVVASQTGPHGTVICEQNQNEKEL